MKDYRSRFGISLPLSAMCLLFCLLGPALEASQTRWWNLSTQAELAQGELKGVSVTSDGKLVPAPAVDEVFDTGEAFVYAALLDRSRNLYLGTGNNGKIFRVGADGRGAEFAKLSDAGVFALASDSADRLYAATSPDGNIYRLDSSGSAQPFFDPGEKYIWSLAMDSANNLYAGTGPKGRIYKVDQQGKGEIFYDSSEAHITALQWDLDGNLLAGTSPNGLLLRITPAGRPSVVYDSPLAEVKAIAVDRYGAVYAAALATPSKQESATPSGKEESSGGAGEPAGEARITVAGAEPGKGLEVYRIDRRSLVETLYSSDSETAYSLLVRNDGNLLAATGPKGRILSISPQRLVTLLVQTPEEQVTQLVANGDKIYAVTSNLGRVFELHSSPSSPGRYESRVLDAEVPSLWGSIRWEAGAGAPVQLYTRSGNTKELDETWGDWQGPYQDADGSPIQSLAARYLQVKVEFPAQGRSGSITSPGQFVEQMSVSYLQNNVAPQVTSLTVHPPGKAFVPLPTASSGGVPPGGPDGAHARSLPLEMRNLNGAQPQPGPRPVYIPGARSFSWDAKDDNGDDLIYSLYIRRQGEDSWNPLKTDLEEDYFTLDGAGFADGTYTVKVIASDRLSNPPGEAMQSELAGKAFTISNAGPRLEIAQPQVAGRDASIQVSVEAGAAMLHQAEYQLDGGDWVIVLPEDGITDGRSEKYAVQLQGLAPGDRVFSMRVIDSVGNVSTRRTVLRVR